MVKYKFMVAWLLSHKGNDFYNFEFIISPSEFDPCPPLKG